MSIFLCILGSIILVSILGFTVSARRKKNKTAAANIIKDKIQFIITQKEGFENYISVFDIFKESYGTFILNKLLDDNKEDKNLKISDNMLSDLIKKELAKKETVVLLADAYIEWISNNIREAEDIEADAIEYHKSFGKEPEGDPELHIKEIEEIQEYSEKFHTVDELMNTGTIEEIE